MEDNNIGLVIFIAIIIFLTGYSIASSNAEYDYNKETMSEREFEEWEQEQLDEQARADAELEYLYR